MDISKERDRHQHETQGYQKENRQTYWQSERLRLAKKKDRPQQRRNTNISKERERHQQETQRYQQGDRQTLAKRELKISKEQDRHQQRERQTLAKNTRILARKQTDISKEKHRHQHQKYRQQAGVQMLATRNTDNQISQENQEVISHRNSHQPGETQRVTGALARRTTEILAVRDMGASKRNAYINGMLLTRNPAYACISMCLEQLAFPNRRMLAETSRSFYRQCSVSVS